MPNLKNPKSTAPSGNEWAVSTTPAALVLTGAGNSQGTALAIPAGQDFSVFTTVAASTGCQLPLSGVSVGEEYVIANHGANALSVYPQTAGKMGTAGANAAYSLAAGKTGYFFNLGLNWTVNP